MKKISFFLLALFIVSLMLSPVEAKEKKADKKNPAEIILPSIDYSKGKTVLQAIKDRHSDRNFADKDFDLQTLSEILWVAGGINREASGGRTAPTARNCQEYDIYAFTKDGVYLYIPQEHKLILKIKGDKRALTGKQPFVAQAALNLLYVTDTTKMKGDDKQHNMIMTAIDAGHISENVYLYCASENLSCVVRAMFDAAAVANLLNLKESQIAILAQSVGYKK